MLEYRFSLDKTQCQMTSSIILTKLHDNACIYGDGLPVNLRFSDMIGSILTAVESIENKVLPFKYCIGKTHQGLGGADGTD
jgi:hypothetical protein